MRPKHTDPRPGLPCLLPHRVPRSPVCPTARSLPPSDAALSAFEQRIQRVNLTEDQILFFPKYGKPPSKPPVACLALPPCAPPQPLLTPAWALRFLRGRRPVPRPGW